MNECKYQYHVSYPKELSLNRAAPSHHCLLSPLLVLRTLMGHKANICSLDFHPYGEFVASGSQDTNIKVRHHSAPWLSQDWAASGTRLLSPTRGGGLRLCGGTSHLCCSIHVPPAPPRQGDVGALARHLYSECPALLSSFQTPVILGCSDLEVLRARLCSWPSTAL